MVGLRSYGVTAIDYHDRNMNSPVYRGIRICTSKAKAIAAFLQVMIRINVAETCPSILRYQLILRVQFILNKLHFIQAYDRNVTIRGIRNYKATTQLP